MIAQSFIQRSLPTSVLSLEPERAFVRLKPNRSSLGQPRATLEPGPQHHTPFAFVQNLRILCLDFTATSLLQRLMIMLRSGLNARLGDSLTI